MSSPVMTYWAIFLKDYKDFKKGSIYSVLEFTNNPGTGMGFNSVQKYSKWYDVYEFDVHWENYEKYGKIAQASTGRFEECLLRNMPDGYIEIVSDYKKVKYLIREKKLKRILGND